MADTEYEAEGTIPDPWSLPLETGQLPACAARVRQAQAGDPARPRWTRFADAICQPAAEAYLPKGPKQRIGRS